MAIEAISAHTRKGATPAVALIDTKKENVLVANPFDANRSNLHILTLPTWQNGNDVRWNQQSKPKWS
jgi:hypothetical protein